MSFSVMIPCHNPDLLMLEQTLCSVRAQLSPAEHQLAIVDDASQDAEPLKTLCHRYAAQYIRPDEELGGVMTHNLCLELADHEFVHLLHPDDLVLQGFYHHIEQMSRQFPLRALYATACLNIDVNGVPFAASSLNALGFSAVSFLPLHQGNPLCAAACVTSREFYGEHGGWHQDLYHTADWEYWARCTIKGGCAFYDWPLACWRVHIRNHSNRLARTAANLRNYLRCAEVASEYMPVNWPEFRRYVATRARGQAALFLGVGELAAASANEELALEMERMAA